MRQNQVMGSIIIEKIAPKMLTKSQNSCEKKLILSKNEIVSRQFYKETCFSARINHKNPVLSSVFAGYKKNVSHNFSESASVWCQIIAKPMIFSYMPLWRLGSAGVHSASRGDAGSRLGMDFMSYLIVSQGF